MRSYMAKRIGLAGAITFLVALIAFIVWWSVRPARVYIDAKVLEKGSLQVAISANNRVFAISGVIFTDSSTDRVVWHVAPDRSISPLRQITLRYGDVPDSFRQYEPADGSRPQAIDFASMGRSMIITVPFVFDQITGATSGTTIARLDFESNGEMVKIVYLRRGTEAEELP